jgi:molybdate/tungstate transport system substrate-binding protein
MPSVAALRHAPVAVVDIVSGVMAQSRWTARRASAARCLAPLAVACAGLAAAGCGNSATAATGGSTTPPGTATVAFPAPLAHLNQGTIGPAFVKTSGQGYAGIAAVPGALGTQITSGSIAPNVLETISDADMLPLMPKSTRWYIRYAATSLVLAYNPAGPFAGRFTAIAQHKLPMRALFPMMERRRFRLGRTDPNIDPQGRDLIYMLELAQTRFHLPAGAVQKILRGPLPSARSPQICPAAALLARLQSGRFDAVGAYQFQAIEMHLPYITLPAEIDLGIAGLAHHYSTAKLTIAGHVVKHGAPLVLDITTVGTADQAAADAFVQFVLSPGGLLLHKELGFTLLTPTPYGDKNAIPSAIRSELNTAA